VIGAIVAAVLAALGGAAIFVTSNNHPAPTTQQTPTATAPQETQPSTQPAEKGTAPETLPPPSTGKSEKPKPPPPDPG
jgi:hypothetical protein